MANTANISYESVSSITYAEGPRAIPKPSGLEVGDVMFLFLFYSRFDTLSTPSGWTVIRNNTTDFGPDNDGAIFYKVADSGDVAASDFSFDIDDGSGSIGGTIVRVSGFNPDTVFEQVDTSFDTNEGTTQSHTVSVTPTTANSFLFAFVHYNITATFSNFSSTGSPTWTVLTQLNGIAQEDLLVLYAPYPSTTEVTNFSFDVSSAGGGARSDLIMFVARTSVSSTGEPALHSASPSFFNASGSAGASGTVDFLSVSPTFFNAEGAGLSPTQWSKQSKNSTTWTKQPKS